MFRQKSLIICEQIDLPSWNWTHIRPWKTCSQALFIVSSDKSWLKTFHNINSVRSRMFKGTRFCTAVSLDCSQSPIFPWDLSMSIVELDGQPSWSFNASKTGESTKCPWVRAVGLLPSTSPTHGHFVLSPVSLASRAPVELTMLQENRGLWTVYCQNVG